MEADRHREEARELDRRVRALRKDERLKLREAEAFETKAEDVEQEVKSFVLEAMSLQTNVHLDGIRRNLHTKKLKGIEFRPLLPS